MNRKTKDRLLFIVGLGATFFALQAAVDLEYKYSENLSNRNMLYEQVCTKADANKDKYLTTDEWKSACKSMGLEYKPSISIFSVKIHENRALRCASYLEHPENLKQTAPFNIGHTQSFLDFSEEQMLRYLAFSEEEIKHLASK
jgi:hypothetical protein